MKFYLIIKDIAVLIIIIGFLMAYGTAGGLDTGTLSIVIAAKHFIVAFGLMITGGVSIIVSDYFCTKLNKK